MSNLQLGYLTAFLAMFVNSLSNFPFTDAARKWGSVALNHYRLVIAFIVLTVLCMIMDKLSIKDLFAGPSLNQYIYIGLSGILGLAVGDYFGFHAMSILGARISSIFNTIAPGATLLFGFLLLNEDINLIGIIGIAVSIGGMIWFLTSGKSKNDKSHLLKHGSVRKGIFFGILAGLCQGFHIVIAKKGFADASYAITPLHITWIRVFAAMVAYYLFTFSRGRLKQDVIVVVREGKDIITKVTLATIWGLVLSIILVMWSMTLCKVAVVQTIISLVPIVVVPMAYVFYKEKMTVKSIIAATVSVAGVFVLIWREDIAHWMQAYLH
ncbi:MAG TPA: DMT family transporter [Bacteroidia bacterium]|jgi:drug/metabolite transporter (DMT)-like permease|nr:DMT family transporter [Bacteroidia bacterium]